LAVRIAAVRPGRASAAEVGWFILREKNMWGRSCFAA
jgi:hypothetical protein